MYLFCVNFSENNLLKEQTNISSLYFLPVMNKLLIEHQLINFSDQNIDKSYLINCEKSLKLPLFDVLPIRENEIFKELTLVENQEIFVAFRNDVFFEINELNLTTEKTDGLVSISDEKGFVFAVLGSIGVLKTLLNKDIELSEIFKHSERYISSSKRLLNSYVMVLNNVKNYKKLLVDILNSKTTFTPPVIAEGIFTDGAIPKGDFSIVPPVFIGEFVQIESGAVIGPDTVIYSNSLISENTSIKNSVLFENVFVSSNCYVDGSVCCDNASIKRNSAVFSGSIIGADALVGEDMTLDNNSVINKKVRYDNFNLLPQKNKKVFSFNNKFEGLSPDKSALLGSAVGVVFKRPKVIVGCDGSPNSMCLKLALLSGLIAAGSECFDIGVTFKSQMFFSSHFCVCDFSVFVSGYGGGTNIEIYNSKNEPISKTDCCNLFDYCNKGEFVFENQDKCKSVRQIKGLRRMYVGEISAFSEENLPPISNIICENKVLLKTINEIVKKCVREDSSENSFSIYMNANGTNLNIKFKEQIYSQKNLKKLVFFFIRSEENIKFFQSDLFKKLWQYDSVFLLFAVLNIIKHTGKNLDVLVDGLPRFYVKNNYIRLKYKDSDIAERLSLKFDFNHQHGVFNIKCKKGYIKLINNNEKGEIKVTASSTSMAVSKELCDFFTEFLPDS